MCIGWRAIKLALIAFRLFRSFSMENLFMNISIWEWHWRIHIGRAQNHKKKIIDAIAHETNREAKEKKKVVSTLNIYAIEMIHFKCLNRWKCTLYYNAQLKPPWQLNSRNVSSSIDSRSDYRNRYIYWTMPKILRPFERSYAILRHKQNDTRHEFVIGCAHYG